MGVTIDPTSTLAEIVECNPALARELERRALDYCCGGQRSLAEACRALDLDPVRVAAELAAVPVTAREDWVDAGPAALVDHLEATHHAYLHRELPRLGALVERVEGVHGDRHPELVEVARTLAELRADLEPHLAKEERVLFPMIRELAEADAAGAAAPSFGCGTLRNPISVMLAEHDAVGALLARMRLITGGYTAPDDGCGSYRALCAGLEELEADTHLHVHEENNLLFPAVVALETRVNARAAV